MSEKDAFYDSAIAPDLLRIGKLAQDNGISLLAVAEWEPGETGQTVALQAGSGFAMRMVKAAIDARGNVDAFFIAIERFARENGHSSIDLAQLGVPLRPNASAEDESHG